MSSGTANVLAFPGPPSPPPCKKAVGSLSDSKVWQHGIAYAIISRRGGGGEAEGEAELRIARLLLFNSVITRLRVSWEHLHKTGAQRGCPSGLQAPEKQTNKPTQDSNFHYECQNVYAMKTLKAAKRFPGRKEQPTVLLP